MDINIVRKSDVGVIVRAGQDIEILSRPKATETRVVQSAAPLPASSTVVPDPGDLTLIFENHLL